jgi:hypothetical protein
VFVYVPGVALVTFTTIVHPPERIVAPNAYLMRLEPAVAVTEPRVQLPVSPLGVAITRFVGKVSSKFTLSVAGPEFVLLKVSVSVEVIPVGLTVVPNAFDTVGGVLAGTVRTALTADALLPALVCRAPAAIVFV